MEILLLMGWTLSLVLIVVSVLPITPVGEVVGGAMLVGGCLLHGLSLIATAIDRHR